MKRLNAYRFTEQFITEGIKYLINAIIPERFQFESRKNEFRARYEGMRAERDLLFLADNRQIVPIDTIDTVLAALYRSIGDIGRDRFYAFVSDKFVGISRPRVQQFLNNQELHQLVQQVKTQHVNTAIVASAPMERWQADLVDLSKYSSPQNRHTNFLLTIIDCFSKHAWVVPLQNKEAATVAVALESVFDSNNGAPSIVQTDNGGEFDAEFEEVLARWDVQHVRSRPYNPQANGQIERFNGTLKRMIQAWMLANETRTYVPQLKHMVLTYNNLLHTGTRQVPARVHANAALWPCVHANIKAQAIRRKKRGRQIARALLAVGDHVRYALLVKAMEKPATFWSKEIYRVMSIERPVHEWEAARYTLHDGRKFTRDRLQKVDADKLVRLVAAAEPQAARPKARAQTVPPPLPPPEPRVQPQRMRAPSSRMKNSFLDM